jgi:hypothetical protein
MGVSAVDPGMFFRPEEDALFSKGLDNTRLFKSPNIDIRNKDDGLYFVFVINGCFKVTGNFYFHWVRTVGTAGANGYGQPFFL